MRPVQGVLSRIAGIAMLAGVVAWPPSAPAQVAADAASTQADAPLVVTNQSRIAAMEYEAWFGPNAVTFQNSAAIPLLQSADMRDVGGGYDSADPKIIRQHVIWMEEMGIDAAIVDLTNDVSCIFNSAWFAKKYLENAGDCPVLQSDYQNIRDNTGNLYPAWTKLGTRLKLIPLLGGVDQNVLYLDTDDKTAFEKEIEYFGALMAKYPGRQVIYEDKPLMLVFVGAAQDPTVADNPLWYQLCVFLKDHPAISDKYTFKFVAGYLDSQPYLWADQNTPKGPVEVAPEYGFWSWVDRLNTSCTTSPCPYYPSYNRAGKRVENFTASIATAGQNGWGCPNSDAPPYCEDDALRYGKGESYATFLAFMDYARQLDPIFLIVHQFNEFQYPDEGWDANTNDDIEPSNQWNARGLKVVQDELWSYHHPCQVADGGLLCPWKGTPVVP